MELGDLISRISARASTCGIDLAEDRAAMLARHAGFVLRANDDLHLTTVTEPDELLERHIGEAFEGAAMLPESATGVLLDVGTGNGWPAIPLVAARPGLRLVMTEASTRKAAFLRPLVAELGLAAEVLEVQVQRSADLEGLVPPARVVISRAMGGWAKVLPRLAPCLAEDGDLLVWAGEELESIERRAVWKRLARQARHPLPGRERSWIWRYRRA